MEVMDLYENAKLKGQKLNLSTLLSKPEFKQNYLTPIRTLPPDDQCEILSEVVGGACTLAEIKGLAAVKKQLSALKTAFTRLTNTSSWEEVQEMFPESATEANIRKFLRCDLKKSIPASFGDFCKRVKNSTEEHTADIDTVINISSTITAHVIKAKPTEVSGQHLRHLKSFEGANLSLVTVEKVCCSHFI